MEFGDVKLEAWMIFSNKEHFLGVFKDYCVQEGSVVCPYKHDNKIYTARCNYENYP